MRHLHSLGLLQNPFSLLAPGVDLALVAVGPGPSDAALALVGLVAESVLAAAAGRTLGFHAVVVACSLVLLLPTRQADLLPLVATGVVAKVVVARLAQDVAVRSVVLVRAHQSEVVLELVLAVVPVHPVLPALQALRLNDPVEQG